jgi:hypothetical protein
VSWLFAIANADVRHLSPLFTDTSVAASRGEDGHTSHITTVWIEYPLVTEAPAETIWGPA